jgi:hypothetical protein
MPTGRRVTTTHYATMPLATPGRATIRELITFIAMAEQAGIPEDAAVPLVTEPTLGLFPTGPIEKLAVEATTQEDEEN